MTQAEQIKTEREIEALIARAYVLRLLLTIERREADGEPITDAWLTAKSILQERERLTRSMAEACGDG